MQLKIIKYISFKGIVETYCASTESFLHRIAHPKRGSRKTGGNGVIFVEDSPSSLNIWCSEQLFTCFLKDAV